VLHRLDHSIHTMRLWGKTKAKELCSEWNMDKFFRLIHNDMSGICLERLHEMKAPGKLDLMSLDSSLFHFPVSLLFFNSHIIHLLPKNFIFLTLKTYSFIAMQRILCSISFVNLYICVFNDDCHKNNIHLE
jgi:hypothetical protein